MVKIPHFSTLPVELKTAINRANYEDKLCPRKDLIFHSFYTHDLKDTKVVIIGQEPYPSLGKSNGLAFGHNKYYTGNTSPTLNNIFKEVKDSVGECTADRTLEDWGRQGVLLLNSRLTTEANKNNAHINLGWEQIVIEFIKELDKICRYKVYMLWGKDAASITPLIDQDTNLVLTAAHPSPFSAKGFFGCDHFAEANDYLERRGKGEIKW